MQDDLPTLTSYLEGLCEQALQETDPVKQERLTAEIYRVIEERRRIQGKKPLLEPVPYPPGLARHKSA